MITFTVYGKPQAQGRPKGAVQNGRVRMYDPTDSKNYKQYVSLIASQHRPSELIQSAVSLTVKVYRPIPDSWSKKKQERAEKGELLPISKPDLSNYLKGVEDALEGILLKNDSQVVDYGDSGKWYGEVPRIEITLRELSA